MEFDSHATAFFCLRMLATADELRHVNEQMGSQLQPQEARLLQAAAEVLEANLPIHGLTSLCVVEYGLEPSDLAWLLREHVMGRNPGVVSGGPDLRRQPWIRRASRPVEEDLDE